jgi:hypothetical protein
MKMSYINKSCKEAKSPLTVNNNPNKMPSYDFTVGSMKMPTNVMKI